MGSWGLGVLGRDEAVGTDTAVAVAEFGDEFLLEGESAGAVVDHDKVVPGPVHFGEGKHGKGTIAHAGVGIPRGKKRFNLDEDGRG